MVRDAGLRVPRHGTVLAVLLTVGLSFWVVVLYRGLRSRLKVEHRTNMPWLFFYAALALPAFYAVGLLAHPRASFAVADFWRFIVVPLWVEDFLELFTTVMVAYLFVLLGVVRQRVAMTVIFLDIILDSSGGVIRMAHHRSSRTTRSVPPSPPTTPMRP